MKTMQKTAETCSNEQLEKLNSVKPKEWMDVQKALLPTIARRLHGRVKTDKDGHVEMVGGYTKYGAHSEREVGGEALFHYRKKRLKNSVGFWRFLDNRLVRTQSLEFNV
jgi:hypothetical protein